MSLLLFGRSIIKAGAGLDQCSEVVEKFPALRPTITEKLISTFGEIKSGKVFRGAMWIVGEYCEGATGEQLAVPS
jgi:hypothetical protein